MNFLARIAKGSFIIKEKEKFLEFLKKLEEKEVILSVEQKRKIRSNEQNRYFHGVIVKMIAIETCGEDFTESDFEGIKYALKAEHLGTEPVHIGKKTWFKAKSTADLTTVEFEDLNRKCRQWAATMPEDGGLGLYIPLPNEVTFPY